MSRLHKPQLWIIAGPNGSGKSTLVERFQGRLTKVPIINPDNIARDLNPNLKTDLSSVSAQAGRMALKQQKKFLADKKSFAIETTLTGKRELRLMAQAKEQG